MTERDEYERVRHRLGVVTGRADDRDEPAESSSAEPAARWIPERLAAARWNPGRRGALAIAAIGVLVAGFTMVAVLRQRPVLMPVPPLPAAQLSVVDSPAGAAGTVGSAAAGPAEPVELVVSVVGQVHRAGLVRLPPGARVADALAAAGGPIPGVDTTAINLAQRVDDGQQIVVGGPTGSSTVGGPTGSSTVGGPTGSSTVGGPTGSSTVGGPTGSEPGGIATPGVGSRVNLNRAGEQELDALPGVGPITARAIVAWRTEHGRFTDVEQLGEVDGIGPARLAKLRESVTV